MCWPQFASASVITFKVLIASSRVTNHKSVKFIYREGEDMALISGFNRAGKDIKFCIEYDSGVELLLSLLPVASLSGCSGLPGWHFCLVDLSGPHSRFRQKYLKGYFFHCQERVDVRFWLKISVNNYECLMGFLLNVVPPIHVPYQDILGLRLNPTQAPGRIPEN